LVATCRGFTRQLKQAVPSPVFYGGNPVLVNTLQSQDGESLLRDPAIMRDQNGIYHVVATLTNDYVAASFVIYDSADLKTWTNGRIVRSNLASHTLWAPDMIYDSARGRYQA
jgi:sucrose-6-phosphate hydrolase SacC (GH32 family)